MAIVLTELKVNLHEKKDGEMDARVFINEISYFYKKCQSYLDAYCDAAKM